MALADASPDTLAAKSVLRPARGTLAVAVLGSALVHAGFLAMPLMPGVHAPVAAPSALLEARLAPEPAPITLEPLQELALPALPEAALMPAPSMPAQSMAPPTPAPTPTTLRSGEMLVAAVPLASRARLGDELLARSVTEFPVEVQFAPRPHEALKARYPDAALAQGIQGDVVVWIVVAPNGDVDDIQFAEGDPIFRDAVVEAIRAGRFQPGADHGQGVRFPLALEFHFELPGGVPAAPDLANAR